jgi:ion channel
VNGPDITNMQMLSQFLFGAGMIMLTVMIHGGGLFGISRFLGIERKLETRIHLDMASPRGLLFTLILVLVIFVLHALEIWLYALLYYVNDALPTLAKAVYFSTITYGTVGFDDQDMQGTWQLVAAIEGINGIVLLGWSTAFIVTVIARISRHGG